LSEHETTLEGRQVSRGAAFGQAVDEVRRRENKALWAKGDERLVGTRYDWLRNPSKHARSIQVERISGFQALARRDCKD